MVRIDNNGGANLDNSYERAQGEAYNLDKKEEEPQR